MKALANINKLEGSEVYVVIRTTMENGERVDVEIIGVYTDRKDAEKYEDYKEFTYTYLYDVEAVTLNK